MGNCTAFDRDLGERKMEKKGVTEHSHVGVIRLLLVLILVCIIVVPLGFTLYSYRNNMLGLIVPSNLNELVNTSELNADMNALSNENVGLHYDNSSLSFSLAVNFTNPFATNLTLDSLSAKMTDHEDGFPLGQISTSGPICIGCNETKLISVSATVTSDAIEHMATVQTLDVDLSDFTIAVQGVVFQSNQVFTFKNVPMVHSEIPSGLNGFINSTDDR